jgi:hypothetical protein
LKIFAKLGRFDLMKLPECGTVKENGMCAGL